MQDFKLIPPDLKWNKKVIKLANQYNDLVSKIKEKGFKKKFKNKMNALILKIEESIIQETNSTIKRDYAYLVQLIEERHEKTIFSPEILVLEEHMLGGSDNEEDLVFHEIGSDNSPPSESKEQFNIESIDLNSVELINLEIITKDDLEKSSQKCAYGDGKILDEHGNNHGDIWRCKQCKTVYHENCLRVCLIMKGSCQVCDVEFLPARQ